MRSNCGFGKSDAAQDELTKLPLQIGGVAVGKTGHGGKPRERRHQHGVVREPEQVERIAADPRRVAGRYSAFDRCPEHRPDQATDLVVEQARELAIVEMARRHQPQPLRFLLIRTVGYFHEMANHALDQFDQCGS